MMLPTETVLPTAATLMSQQCHRAWEELPAPDLMIAELGRFRFPNHFSSKELAWVNL